MDPAYLHSFKMVKPKNLVKQKTLLQWLSLTHQQAATNSNNPDLVDLETLAKLFERYSIKETQISERYTECDDVFSSDFSTNEIYKLDSNVFHGVDINARAKFFSARALEVFKKIYNENSAEMKPDHIFHVTCTGYISPSAAQLMVANPTWIKETEITHAYHMGCYAAMPAVRLAQAVVLANRTPNKEFTADIVHTEMCGLHMNPLAHTPEQMVVQTLFADGHMKYTVTDKPKVGTNNLKVLALLEKVVPDSAADMSWTPAAWGMEMNLSREVPRKIKSEIKIFTTELFEKAKLDLADGLASVFAIHPGGPKIIDAVQESLELSESQVIESKRVLLNRGNMSSATLPHVWNEILEASYPQGTKVISYAFGPGLTLFGMVSEIC